MSLIEMMRIFPDDATAEKWFIEQRWPHSVHCPHCGSDNVQARQKAEYRYQPSKAELEKGLSIDASFERLTKAVLKPVKKEKNKLG